MTMKEESFDQWMNALRCVQWNALKEGLEKHPEWVNTFERHNDVSPLMVAINNKVLVDWLIERGAQVNLANKKGWTALMIAATNNNEESLKALIQAGADLNQRDNRGESAVFWAVGVGSLVNLRCLLKEKTAINAQNYQGRTVLMKAVAENDPEIMLCLLENGADMEMKDSHGKTAMDYAQEERYEGVERVLEAWCLQKKMSENMLLDESLDVKKYRL